MANRIALIIANSEFDDRRLTRLATPSRDAEVLAAVLRDPKIGGFDVTMLVNKPLRLVRPKVQQLYARRRRDDLLLLYYSGHGFKDDYGDLYLAVKDTEKDLFGSTGLDAAFVRDQLDKSQSQRKVVVLDCCHSGAFVGREKSVLGTSVGVEEAFRGRGYGRVILTATNAVEYAWEGDELLGEVDTSVFTHFLVQGLKTGKADLDSDGEISHNELYEYVYDQVISSGLTKQEPQMWAHKVRGKIVVARSDFQLRQRKLERLYQEVKERLNNGYWAEAKDLCERIEALEPSYRDVSELAKEAKERILQEQVEKKREVQLSQLYAEAQRLSQAGRWKTVLQIFEQMAAIEPDYSDPEGLLPKARRKAAELKRQRELSDLYGRAVTEMEARHWQAAQQLLLRVQEMEAGFREAERLLDKIEKEIAQEEAEQQRQIQIAGLYKQAQEFTRSGQWQQALEKMEEVDRLDPEFADTERIVAKAQAELTREEEEKRHKRELDALYAEAVELLHAEQYQKALEAWNKVRTRDPRYRDSQKVRVRAMARKRRAEFVETVSQTWTKLSEARFGVPGWALVAGGFVLLAGLFLIVRSFGFFPVPPATETPTLGTGSPTPTVLSTFSVPTRSPTIVLIPTATMVPSATPTSSFTPTPTPETNTPTLTTTSTPSDTRTATLTPMLAPTDSFIPAPTVTQNLTLTQQTRIPTQTSTPEPTPKPVPSSTTFAPTSTSPSVPALSTSTPTTTYSEDWPIAYGELTCCSSADRRPVTYGEVVSKSTDWLYYTLTNIDTHDIGRPEIYNPVIFDVRPGVAVNVLGQQSYVQASWDSGGAFPCGENAGCLALEQTAEIGIRVADIPGDPGTLIQVQPSVLACRRVSEEGKWVVGDCRWFPSPDISTLRLEE